jgi:VWFA-related protein
VKNSAISSLVLAALLTAQDTPDIRVDVDLVTVACSVTDRNGAPVRNLKLEDFSLSDNGEPREIRKLWQESDLPLTVALVADVSGSQQEFVGSHRDAVARFLKQVIGPGDRAMIVQVSRQSWLISDLTGSAADLRAAAKRIGQPETRLSRMLGPPCRNARMPSDNCGGTALWHGPYYTAMALRPVTGRKAIVVLSDGFDTGSDVSLSNLIEAAQSAEAVVYSIQYSVSTDRISRMVAEAGAMDWNASLTRPGACRFRIRATRPPLSLRGSSPTCAVCMCSGSRVRETRPATPLLPGCSASSTNSTSKRAGATCSCAPVPGTGRRLCGFPNEFRPGLL